MEKSFPREIKKMSRKVVQCRYPQLDVFSGHGFGQTLGQRPLEAGAVGRINDRLLSFAEHSLAFWLQRPANGNIYFIS